MRSKEDIKEILDYFQTTEEHPVNFDEEAIAAAYEANHGTQSLAIKILSVFGGILASLAFLGSLLLAGLYHSEAGLLVVGLICLVAAIWINKKYDAIISDTLSVSFFILGFILSGLSLTQSDVDDNIICILFAAVASATIAIAQNYILSFVSALIINGSILVLILSGNGSDYLIPIYVSVSAAVLAYFYLREAKIITSNKAFAKLYSPIRIGLTFSFLSGLILLGKKGLFQISPHCIWLPSAVMISVITYVIYRLLDVLNLTKTRHKAAIYILTVLALLPTVFSPAISGAILLILSSFLVNYKTGLVSGIIAFIYFISQYYYDLDFTLLTKSGLLFSSGVLFLALYLCTRKKLTA